MCIVVAWEGRESWSDCLAIQGIDPVSMRKAAIEFRLMLLVNITGASLEHNQVQRAAERINTSVVAP